MKLFYNCICFIAVCCQTAMNVRSEFYISFSAGITNTKSRLPNTSIYEKLNEFRKILAKPWDDSVRLIENTDYISIQNAESIGGRNICGFGNYAAPNWNFDSVTYKIKQYLENLRSELTRIFPESEGFFVSGVRDTYFGNGLNVFTKEETGEKYFVFNRISIPSIYLTNKNFPKFSARIIERSDYIKPHYFSVSSSRPIEDAIIASISPVESDIIQSWAAATNPVTTKKNGLTLGLSGAYSKALFPKASSTYGLYMGAECFVEINPNESKSNGFAIKEKSFGLRPFVGIIKKDNWTIYALGGVKCAKRDIKSDMFNVHKGKLSYEIGVGSDYILSERFSISAKFIKGITSKFNINGLAFQTSSTKILFSLNYHF